MAIVESQCVINARQIGRIDRIVQSLTGRSRAETRALFDHACVRLNGEISSHPGTVVTEGDVVLVRHDPHIRYRPKRQRQPESGPFRLVFEDRQLIVVDKSAAVLTVPTDRGETNTLLDAVDRFLRQQGHRGRVSVVHRLDRGTSGLLVFGKDPRIARELMAQFRVRKAERRYDALVAGRVENTRGAFDSHLSTTKSLRRYSVRPGDRGERGERAVTHYRVVRTFASATHVEATLDTGRRNQIRVQFAEAGHPILGDERYLPEQARHADWKHKRLALHASLLGFDHPLTGERLRFESTLPSEFEDFFARQTRPRSR